MNRLTLFFFALGIWWIGAVTAQAQSTATYEVTFESTWSAATHPQNFPSNPHFSGLVGGTHDASVAFWAGGALASPGIENMAETGGKFPMIDEVEAAVAAGSAEFVLSGGGIGTSPGEVRLRFSLTEDYPLVTLVSMLAPSPDWFVGVAGLSLRDGGEWIQDLTVDLFVYDAGTDSGPTYTSPNQDTNPPAPIALIQAAPFMVGGTVPPVGQYRFLLRSVDEPTGTEADAPDDLGTHRLSAAYPNPFTPQTAFTLTVRQPQQVRIDLYDLTGRRVDTLFEGALQAGTPHRFTIDGGSLPSGVYLYRVVGEHFQSSHPVVRVR